MAKEYLKGSTGMLLGKFMPPHLGHKYLVDFASGYVDRLTVIVATIDSEPMPGGLRYRWMKEMFPAAEVVHMTDDNPQEPGENPDFWNIWHDSIRKFIPRGPDFVFASEEYGWKLADILGAKYVPVDHLRVQAPVTASMIRKDPIGHWRFIPSCVRPHYVKRVCLIGPESTGKTTMAQKLAEKYDTVHVAEYARGLLDHQGGECFKDDIPRIARGADRIRGGHGPPGEPGDVLRYRSSYHNHLERYPVRLLPGVDCGRGQDAKLRPLLADGYRRPMGGRFPTIP